MIAFQSGGSKQNLTRGAKNLPLSTCTRLIFEYDKACLSAMMTNNSAKVFISLHRSLSLRFLQPYSTNISSCAKSIKHSDSFLIKCLKTVRN